MYSHNLCLGKETIQKQHWNILVNKNIVFEDQRSLPPPPYSPIFFTSTRSKKKTITKPLVIKSHVIDISSFHQKRSNPGNYLLVKKPAQELTAGKPSNLTLGIQQKVTGNGSLNSACIFH